jgi:hypothetical protein
MNDKQIWQNTLSKLKARCKKDDIPFALTINDVIKLMNDTCVYTGLPLTRNDSTGGGWQPSTPTLARHDPSVGYVPDNVFIVSNLAATIMSALDPNQLSMLAYCIHPKAVEVPLMQQLDDISTKVFATATSKQCDEIVELMELKYAQRIKALRNKSG